MSESTQLHTIVCEEVFDENSVPSEEEVLDYAAKIGIDPKSEPHLLPIALNGLMHPLPPEWKPCFDSDLQKWYYYNTETKKSQWEHPLDTFYRQVVRRGRSEGYSSAGDDDSKTTAKEDLKSFEEASDILSSKSVDIKPDSGEEKREFAVMNERGPLLKGSQPLLLRRKQLQSGQDPLHVAKLINSALRKSLPKEDVPQRSSYADIPLPGSTLRRSHTSDLITPHPPPIKGILRESSFSGSMSSTARASSVRLNPLQGEAGTPQHEGEDEKKRSVRFADFERKSLDIRVQLSDSDETYSDTGESSSDSPEAEGVVKELKAETKPKLLSPLPNSSFTVGPMGSDFLKTRKFTVTPVKETVQGFPVSDIKENYSDLDEDESISESPDVKDTKEKNDLEQVLSSPPHDESNDFPRTRKFTVTPVKSPAFSFPVSELKGLFRTESVGPLDSDSDLSLGIKGGDSLTTGVSREADDENVSTKLDHTPVKEDKIFSQTDSSPMKLSKSDNSEGHLKRAPPLTTLLSTSAESKDLDDLDSNAVKPVESTTNILEITSNPIAISEAAKQREKLESWKKKLNEELEQKIEELKILQTENLARIKDNLMKTEELEKEKLQAEFEEKINKIKELLEAEYVEKEKALRETSKKELDELSSELEKERKKEMESIRAEHNELLQKWKDSQEEAFREEKIRLDNESFETLQKFKTELNDKLENLKKESETQLEELTVISEKRVNDLKLKYEEIIKEIQLRHRNEIKEIEDNHNIRLEVLKRDKESELLRTEGEWEDRLTATSLSQKAHLESIEKEHEGRLARLRADWEREEADIRKRRMPLEQQALPVDYEKLRCEKRLLEDKYRSLKEKYVQLKSDMKIAVEKKLQARARRKREELEKGETLIERPKNLNTDLQPSSLVTPKITVGEVSPRDVTDPSSDDQYTLSYNHPEKYGGSKKGRSHRRDHTPTSRLDETRSQADEISGDIYLRHPLSSLGLSRSAEVDFYRQRLLAEEEHVRVARESLEEQRRNLEVRDASENNNTLGLHQQERDLNDLEVSLHRTRALFGEKMIRLRLLGQTLSRLADDTTSPSSSSGREVMSPNNVLQNLDNINAEIREIWNQLNKNQAGLISGGGTGEVPQKTEDKSVGKSSGHTHRPSKRSEIEARLQGLRDWLQKPPPPDWAQLTL